MAKSPTSRYPITKSLTGISFHYIWRWKFYLKIRWQKLYKNNIQKKLKQIQKGKLSREKNLIAENPNYKWVKRNPRRKVFHSKVWRTKSLLKNSHQKNSDIDELLRINLIPKISTAKSPATTFSPTQGKTANRLVTKSLKMKHPTAKSLEMKNPAVKNL